MVSWEEGTSGNAARKLCEERKKAKEYQKTRKPLCDGACEPRAHDGTGLCASCIKYWISDENTIENYNLRKGDLIMPNWVQNTVRIYADDRVLNKIRKDCFNKEDEFDFELVIPMPDNIFRGNLGQEEREKYGEDNWYDWSVNHWGTKWNCSFGYVSQTDGKMVIEYQTAWSTPVPIVEALAEKYHIERIECEYADEDMGYNCGLYGFNADKEYYEEDFESQEAALRFACEVWGYDYDEYTSEWDEE